MKKVKCVRIKILNPQIGDSYCIEHFEFALIPCGNNGEIRLAEIDNKINVRIKIDTWYRTDDFIVKQVLSELTIRGFEIQNLKEMKNAIECRSFYCDYLA